MPSGSESERRHDRERAKISSYKQFELLIGGKYRTTEQVEIVLDGTYVRSMAQRVDGKSKRGCYVREIRREDS